MLNFVGIDSFIFIHVYTVESWFFFLGCKTNGGAVPNQPCKFPFIYKDKEFSSCTEEDYGVSWCATKTDAEEKYVIGEWGHCDEGCDVLSGMIRQLQ